ncbi:restriction endonuclease subunit S [Thomasclavelia sp.]|uniref:restriction endonuclease subunit S n=1 Tax=Thomasclavelia sp. TaxID=3025757 RepID=UPI0025FEC1E0|nr:restriction endonuclease subunit S [Thomasclavelia sp.]
MEYRTVEDWCEILDSRRIPITAKDRIKGPYPYYGANGIQDYVNNYIFDDELVLLAEDGGNFGSKDRPIAYRASGKCWVNNHAHVLKPKRGLNVDYLCYSLMFYDTNGLVNGATRQKLTQSTLRKMKIPYIDIDTQIEIVKKIKLAQKVLDSKNKEILLLDELIKARFVEMFGEPILNDKGWDKNNLSNLIEKANNGLARRGKDKNGEIVLRLVELQSGFIDYSNPNRIILNEKEKNKYLLKENDFLFARVNGNPENVGRCAVFREINEPVYHNDHIIRIHFKNGIFDGTYLCHLLNSSFGKRQIEKQIKTSAGQYTISQEGIGAIVAIIPPIELQNRFAGFVHQVDKSRLEIQKSLEKTQELFDSLMQKYFG